MLLDHLAKHAYMYRPEKPFLLVSGKYSDEYLDCKLALSQPGAMAALGRVILTELEPRVVAIGGLTMGSDPIAMSTSQASANTGQPLRWFSVRKESKAHGQKKLIEGAVRDLTSITGQKPQVTKARKSIAQFKLREGMPIGAHVTLRGDRMWEFLDRLLTLALPRIRDFRGLSPKQFDGRGNYTFGLTEQVMFHEIDQDKVDRPRGMDITIVTTATNDDEGRALLKHLGFPFAER